MAGVSISFKDYVNRQHKSGAVERYFLADALRDRSFPNFKSWGDLRSYLRRREDAHEALLVGRGVWRSYLDYLKERHIKLPRSKR